MINRNRRRTIAAIATVAFHAAVLAVMVCLFLSYDPASEPVREWPPADSSEILLGGEYVMTGDIPEPGHQDEPAPEQSEAAEASSPAPDPTPAPPAPEPVLTANEPSPAKAKPSEESRQKADARKAEEEKRLAEQKKQQEAAAAINSRVSFGKGSGQSGQPDGNSATGAVSGVSAAGLGNRTAVALPQPPRGPMGSIVIAIKVDRDGNVTSASYSSGTGAAAANADARRQCIAAAKRARFSASTTSPATQSGTLTYVYK